MRLPALCFLIILLVGSGPLTAQELFEPDMNQASAWNVVQDADTQVAFGFDYSTLGIPPAPNGDDTLGIRLAANVIEPGVAASISVSPKDLSFGGQYLVLVDVWFNYYGEPDNIGTTEFGGVFVGFDPTAGETFDGGGLVASTDGDAARDFQLYKDTTEIRLDTGQYDIASQESADPEISAAFPGQEVPELQVDDGLFDPPNELVFADDGTMAFGWHTFLIEVDANAGTAHFMIDDLSIGTIDASVGDPVGLAGGVALTWWDAFASVCPVPEFAFGVFDNLFIQGRQPSVPGDFDGDGELTELDINALSQEIHGGGGNSLYDVNADGDVDLADHKMWVEELRNTYVGDADLNGEFNSSDFVAVFVAGKYETGQSVGWGQGDWNADLVFGSGDFVAAFVAGGYEKGLKPQATAVPEPAGGVLGCLGLLLGILTCRRCRNSGPSTAR